MAFGKNKTLRVEFFEVEGRKMIGYDEMKPSELPEDFQDETWVEIDGDRWKVVGAEPRTRRKARKSGTMSVQVELVERRTPVQEPPTLEVKEVPVFRFPSRADQMPRMSGHREALALLEMGTWEWRDREFTLATNRSVAREVFAKIEELTMINGTVRDGRTFYTRQYERYEFFAPLRGSKVLLENIVTEYFPTSKTIDGLTFLGSDQVADSTFVFSIDSGIVFYGQEFDEVVRYLGVYHPSEIRPEALRQDSKRLAEFMQKKGLIVIDWPLRKIVEADDAVLLDYFLSGFTGEAVADARAFLDGHPPLGTSAG
jgi:hypothetical protein